MLAAGFMGQLHACPFLHRDKALFSGRREARDAEENRELFLRDCGFISHDGMKETCRAIVYCQDYDALAYERMGCEGLLTKKTSPALLDLALQERRSYEYDRTVRGE
jgi:hypothetical protein